MYSTGRRYLDRRGTVMSVTTPKKPEFDDDTTPHQSPIAATPVAARDAERKLIRTVGPESEGIEAITGPTVEKRPQTAKEAEDEAAGEDYAKELLNQFSRPQTLMLKDMMPMPSGTLLMPAMPPVPVTPGEEVMPDAVNFDRDNDSDDDEIEGGVPMGPDGGSHSPDDSQSRPRTAETIKNVRPRAAIQDTKTIAALSSPEERAKAYDALRADIAEGPNPLGEWVEYQMVHNDGEQLLKTQIVTVDPESSIRKSKSRGHFAGRVEQHGEAAPSGRAEEKLEKMGRGAMKLGEKAGGKVGGWMKRVGGKKV